MATDLEYKCIPVAATVDLSGAGVRFKGITFGGAIAATNLQCAGILRHAGKSGENVSLMYQGVFKAQFGTAVNTVGFGLKVTTSGFIVACASGDSSIGRSIALSASGDIAQAYFDFRNLGYWAQNV